MSYATEPKMGREMLPWPQPWSGIGYPWHDDCRVRYAPFGSSAGLAAAAKDLLDTLVSSPDVYWLSNGAETELSAKYGIHPREARKLLQRTPDSRLVDDSWVWCRAGISDDWPSFKARVLSLLPTDRLMSLDEVVAVVGREDDATVSTFSALVKLTWEGAAMSVRGTPDSEPLYCRAIPDAKPEIYDGLYNARMAASAPQPAA